MPKAKSKADDSLISFDSDSPLFAKKKPRAKAAPKRPRKKVNPLGKDSPLISKPKATPKKRGPKSKAEIEEAAIITENKRVAAKQARRQKTKKRTTTKELPNVKSPADCKHILPAFKKFLNAKWKLLDASHAEAQTVGNYIRGVANMCREKRPKEYDELVALANAARQIANDKS